jgi:hypothetical protein
MAKVPSTEAGQATGSIKIDRSRLTRALIVALVGLIIWFLPPFGNLKPQAMHLTAIFVATILGLVLSRCRRAPSSCWASRSRRLPAP